LVWGEQAKVAQQVLDQNPDQQQQNITYDITGFDPRFVDKFALTSDQLDLLSTGTALQGYNQNVLIYLLKKAENLDQLKSNNPYIYLLLDSSIRNIKSALKANNTNNLQKTNFFLNCAWETLEFTKAAVEGIVIGTAEGLMSPFTLAYDLYTNPESYVKACVKCILALGDLYNDDFIVDTDKVERDAKELRASIDAFVDEVGKKWDEADKYDVTRTIFQYGSEIPSSGMSFSLVGNLRKIMLTKGKILAKDVKKLFTKIGKKVVNSIKKPPSINTVTEGFIAPNGVVKEVEKDVAQVVESIVAKGEQQVVEIEGALANEVETESATLTNTVEQNTNQITPRQRTNLYEEDIEKFYKFLDEAIVDSAIIKYGDNLTVTERYLEELTNNGLVGDKIKLSRDYWSHIFGQDCKITKRIDSGIINMKKNGCHIKENLKNLNLKNITVDPEKGIFGKIKVRTWDFNKATNQGRFISELSPKSLFPWPKEMVADKIIESLTDSKYFVKILKDGRDIILFVEIDGATIKHVIRCGKLITSYPVELIS